MSRIALPCHSVTADNPCVWPGCSSFCAADELCSSGGRDYVRGHYACPIHRSVNGARGPCDACVTEPKRKEPE